METARQVRADLDRTLQPYLGALLREQRGARAGNAVPVQGSATAAPSPTAVVAQALLLPDTRPAARPSGPPRPAGVDSVP